MNTNNTGQIYTLLVTKSEQEGYPLEGIVAYSIYKKEKIKFIEDYIKANPTATEKQIQKAKDTLRNNHSTDDKINQYRLDARKIIEDIRIDDLNTVNLDSINNALIKERPIISEIIPKICAIINFAVTNYF